MAKVKEILQAAAAAALRFFARPAHCSIVVGVVALMVYHFVSLPSSLESWGIRFIQVVSLLTIALLVFETLSNMAWLASRSAGSPIEWLKTLDQLLDFLPPKTKKAMKAVVGDHAAEVRKHLKKGELGRARWQAFLGWVMVLANLAVTPFVKLLRAIFGKPGGA